MIEGEKRKDGAISAKQSDIHPEIHVGMFKHKEKIDLENAIVDTLKNLNTRLTKKEIVSLMNRIEVGSGLEGLRNELEKEKKLENTNISDETLRMIFDLFHEVEQIAASGLEELRLELKWLNESKEFEINKLIYITNNIPWIKRLEESELWKSIVIDIAGIAVWALDSVHAILKFLLTIIKDLVLLPKHVTEHLQKKAHKTQRIKNNTTKTNEAFVLDEDETNA